LWLAHAAGVLEKEGHTVKLIDAPAAGLTYEETYQRVYLFKPDLTILDTSTPSIFNDINVAENIKKKLPGTFIALVGTHPSALPEETLSLSDSVDAIARKEFDYTTLDLANTLSSPSPNLHKVLGLSFRENGKILSNPDRPFIEDLDRIPFVSSVYKKHLNIHDYFYAHVRYPTISIFAGRGCPGRCTFCVYPQVMFGHKYRHRSPEHFVEELIYIQREFPNVREVLVDDDCLTANKRFVHDVCNLIIKKKVKLTWSAETRVNLDFETMQIMKAAGCRLLVPGFESGVQEILNNIKKGTLVDQISIFVENARKAGLLVHGCFMAGNPGETKETLKDTLNLALKMPLDTCQFFPLMVYPGTEAYDWAKSNNYLTTSDYRKWVTNEGLHNCVVSTPELSARDLVDFCNYARRAYYLSPKYLSYKLLQVINSPGEMKKTLKSAKTFLKYLFKKSA
jgi:radical SAM superfamily enzyme YgiQ (UPF0313 family)